MKLFSRSKGIIAQLKVELAAAQKNLPVSIPTNPDSNYDILVDSGGVISRAQIKYCNRAHSGNSKDYLLELRLDNKAAHRKYYNKKDIDILLVFLPKLDIILKYGPDKFHKKKQIHINLKNEKSPHYFGKYLW